MHKILSEILEFMFLYLTYIESTYMRIGLSICYHHPYSSFIFRYLGTWRPHFKATYMHIFLEKDLRYLCVFICSLF